MTDLEMLAGDAQPGPWEAHHNPFADVWEVLRISQSDDDDGFVVAECRHRADAELIAELHSRLPNLLGGYRI